MATADAQKILADEILQDAKRKTDEILSAAKAEAEKILSQAKATAQSEAEKILAEHALFNHTRYIAQMSVGSVTHADVLRSMELFATKVAPVVRTEVARRTTATLAADPA